MPDKHKKKPEKTVKQINKDVTYDRELADSDDIEAAARAEAATQRVNRENI